MSENKITKYGTQAGKGDKRRPTNEKSYRENFERIFRVKNKNKSNDN